MVLMVLATVSKAPQSIDGVTPLRALVLQAYWALRRVRTPDQIGTPDIRFWIRANTPRAERPSDSLIRATLLAAKLPRRAGAEPLVTGRARPYDPSTLRRDLKEMVTAGAVAVVERAVEEQVEREVGAAKHAALAHTDMFDQPYYTKAPAHAGPIGALNNKLLAAVYVGMTTVRPKGGPVLVYHLSWHKPAAPSRRVFSKIESRVRRQEELRDRVAALQAEPLTKKVRPPTGLELLCKYLLLLLYNGLALLLARSAMATVRMLTPAKVRDLLWGRHAFVDVELGKVTLRVDPVTEARERRQQDELLRLFNDAHLRLNGAKVQLHLAQHRGTDTS